MINQNIFASNKELNIIKKLKTRAKKLFYVMGLLI